jgi:hypothetical protein
VADRTRPSASSSMKDVSVGYRSLLAKARKFPHGEKRFKRALIEHAASRLGEIVQAGATDAERVKAVKEALSDLKRYASVSHTIILDSN